MHHHSSQSLLSKRALVVLEWCNFKFLLKKGVFLNDQHNASINTQALVADNAKFGYNSTIQNHKIFSRTEPNLPKTVQPRTELSVVF